MDIESIKSLTRISRSLWGDREKSIEMSEDTLSHVALLRMSEEQTIDRASKVLIERAEKNPPSLLALQHPFYRLNAIERFLLTALHVEKWSYQRISRVLGIEEKLIEPWAWATRMKFCFQELSVSLEYPKGPTHLGRNCPDYDLSQPWTQRLLDDELLKRERMFLQNHAMVCDSCRKTLNQCRDLFFKIEALIPVSDAIQETNQASNRIYQTWIDGESAYRPIKTTFRESIIRFLYQPKVQYALVILSLAGFYLVKRNT